MDPSAYPLHAETEKEHWWFVARREILKKTTATFSNKASRIESKRILEVGSGTGGNLAWLSQFGQVCAVEPDEFARKYSSEQYPQVEHLAGLELVVDSILQSSAQMGEERQRFDAAFALDVLEHLEEPVSVAKQVAESLVDGGYFLVTVPAHQSLYGAHDAYLHHLRRYSKSLLKEQLEAAGFEIVFLSPMNCGLFPVAVLSRILEWALSFVRKSEATGTPRGMSIPPRWVNSIFTNIFAFEKKILPNYQLPWGLSLICLAQKKSQGRY